jgi:hypothetical protein
MTRHEDVLETTKVTKVAKIRTQFYFVFFAFFVVHIVFARFYSPTACSAGIGGSTSTRRDARRPPSEGRKRRTSTPRLRTL